MRPLEIGLVLPLLEDVPTGRPYRWDELKARALHAESVGYDTIWVPDELVWSGESMPEARGFWEGVSMASALAAVTDSVKVGSWVFSALHRNPGVTVKAVEAIDEISGGRFVFGFGSGHSGAQGRAFGFPEDKIVGRYEEALEIVISLLQDGRADYQGQYHSANEQLSRPRGPRPGGIPLMLAGHGPRTMGLAARHGDIWSCFATKTSLPEGFAEMIENFNRVCEGQGRDPSEMGKSVGIFIEPTEVTIAEEAGLGVPLRGSLEELVENVHRFAEMGFTMLELMPLPDTQEAAERLAQMISILDS